MLRRIHSALVAAEVKFADYSLWSGYGIGSIVYQCFAAFDSKGVIILKASQALGFWTVHRDIALLQRPKQKQVACNSGFRSTN